MNPMLHIRTVVFGVSQDEMAQIAGVTQPTVSRWEQGEFPPSGKPMQAIRAEAARRRVAWDDSFFFAAPVAPDRAPQEGAAI